VVRGLCGGRVPVSCWPCCAHGQDARVVTGLHAPAPAAGLRGPPPSTGRRCCELSSAGIPLAAVSRPSNWKRCRRSCAAESDTLPSGCACARPRRVPPRARIPRPGHRRARGGQVGHLLASERHQGARRGAAGSARSCQARSLCGEDEEGGGAARRRRSCTHVSDALACSLATPQVWAGSGALTGFELGSDRRLRIQPSTKAWPARAALPLPFWLCRPGRLRGDAAWLAGRHSCAPRWPTRSTRSLC